MFAGIAAVAVGFLLFGLFAVQSLFGSSVLAQGWAWVLICLHWIGGLVLLGLGVVGEYVGRIYEQVKDRPLYVLKENSFVEPATLPKPLPRKDAA
jgi:dolichol-phosphate mannosyltransferase